MKGNFLWIWFYSLFTLLEGHGKHFPRGMEDTICVVLNTQYVVEGKCADISSQNIFFAYMTRKVDRNCHCEVRNRCLEQRKIWQNVL
jgi:hypothetical protein